MVYRKKQNFVGAYVEDSVKEFLVRRAVTKKTNVSDVLTEIIQEEMKRDQKVSTNENDIKKTSDQSK